MQYYWNCYWIQLISLSLWVSLSQSLLPNAPNTLHSNRCAIEWMGLTVQVFLFFVSFFNQLLQLQGIMEKHVLIVRTNIQKKLRCAGRCFAISQIKTGTVVLGLCLAEKSTLCDLFLTISWFFIKFFFSFISLPLLHLIPTPLFHHQSFILLICFSLPAQLAPPVPSQILWHTITVRRRRLGSWHELWCYCRLCLSHHTVIAWHSICL